MKATLIGIYAAGCLAAMVGLRAGWVHQCKTEPPAAIYAGAFFWPVAAAWTAFKNGSPLWNCPRSR